MNTIICSPATEYLQKMESDSVDFIYVDPPYYCQRNFGEFDDRWNSVHHYVASLEEQFHHSKRVLKEHGNICVHVDWHASHWIRVALEKVFGEEHFRNEIIWCYSSGGASSKHFSRKHDNLFVYAKNGEKCRFNPMREPYPRDYGDRPGFHPDGRIMNDWWQIGILSTTAKERTGYPTQKPLQLLERLIQAYTNEGDTVLDYYCGSGTTGVVAKTLGRNYILVDKNQTAIDTANERLKTKGFEEIMQ